MSALRLTASCENLGHSNVFLIAGDDAVSHKDGPTPGGTFSHQGEDAWKPFKDGQSYNICLSDGVIEFAKIYEEMKDFLLILQEEIKLDNPDLPCDINILDS